MFETEEHLNWCFQKDQIDFDTPNEMLTQDYLNKAREALEVAELLEVKEYYDWSVTASYYAMYFALTALLRKCGFEVENHACAISVFEVAFAENGELNKQLVESIREGKNDRVETQYGLTRTTDIEVEKKREDAIEFVTELTGYLEGLSASVIDQAREEVERFNS